MKINISKTLLGNAVGNAELVTLGRRLYSFGIVDQDHAIGDLIHHAIKLDDKQDLMDLRRQIIEVQAAIDAKIVAMERTAA